MPSITIRNVSAEVHRRLRIRSARNGRSMEGELRYVLAIAAGLRPAPESPSDNAASGRERAPAGSEPADAPVPQEVFLKLRDILHVRPAAASDNAGVASKA